MYSIVETGMGKGEVQFCPMFTLMRTGGGARIKVQSRLGRFTV